MISIKMNRKTNYLRTKHTNDENHTKTLSSSHLLFALCAQRPIYGCEKATGTHPIGEATDVSAKANVNRTIEIYLEPVQPVDEKLRHRKLETSVHGFRCVRQKRSKTSGSLQMCSREMRATDRYNFPL